MSGFRLLTGDVLERLADLDSASVQTCVTSPPYWGLRDYGESGQLGLEATPGAYVERIVEVFAEVRRVLRDDGTVWLNLGDSYASGGRDWYDGDFNGGRGHRSRPDTPPGLKAKDLVGIPWRVAFALQQDGWWLRSDIVWSKLNPMPESVVDRPTRSHEYLFLLAKSARYYYDREAIREEDAGRPSGNGFGGGRQDHRLSGGLAIGGTEEPWQPGGGRNRRSVWHIPTQPYAEAHFATFPTKLVEPCILAGSRPVGALVEPEVIATPLGARAGEDPSLTTGRAGMNRPRGADEGTRPMTRHEQSGYAAQLRASPARQQMEAEAGGEAFAHYVRTDRAGARPIPPALLEAWVERGWLKHEERPAPVKADPASAMVLDPFVGSGTAGVVALRHDRDFVGIDLNAECEVRWQSLSSSAALDDSIFERLFGPPSEDDTGRKCQRVEAVLPLVANAVRL